MSNIINEEVLDSLMQLFPVDLYEYTREMNGNQLQEDYETGDLCTHPIGGASFSLPKEELFASAMFTSHYSKVEHGHFCRKMYRDTLINTPEAMYMTTVFSCKTTTDFHIEYNMSLLKPYMMKNEGGNRGVNFDCVYNFMKEWIKSEDKRLDIDAYFSMYYSDVHAFIEKWTDSITSHLMATVVCDKNRLLYLQSCVMDVLNRPDFTKKDRNMENFVYEPIDDDTVYCVILVLKKMLITGLDTGLLVTYRTAKDIRFWELLAIAGITWFEIASFWMVYHENHDISPEMMWFDRFRYMLPLKADKVNPIDVHFKRVNCFDTIIHETRRFHLWQLAYYQRVHEAIHESDVFYFTYPPIVKYRKDGTPYIFYEYHKQFAPHAKKSSIQIRSELEKLYIKQKKTWRPEDEKLKNKKRKSPSRDIRFKPRLPIEERRNCRLVLKDKKRMAIETTIISYLWDFPLYDNVRHEDTSNPVPYKSDARYIGFQYFPKGRFRDEFTEEVNENL